METANMSTALWGILIDCGYSDYHELHLDWLNSFISTQGFADYHDISRNTAEQLIDNAIALSW